jgi:hypothetical protein
MGDGAELERGPFIPLSKPPDRQNKPLVEYQLLREPRINKLRHVKFNIEGDKEGDKYDDAPILTVGQCAVWP